MLTKVIKGRQRRHGGMEMGERMGHGDTGRKKCKEGGAKKRWRWKVGGNKHQDVRCTQEGHKREGKRIWRKEAEAEPSLEGGNQRESERDRDRDCGWLITRLHRGCRRSRRQLARFCRPVPTTREAKR